MFHIKCMKSWVSYILWCIFNAVYTVYNKSPAAKQTFINMKMLQTVNGKGVGARPTVRTCSLSSFIFSTFFSLVAYSWTSFKPMSVPSLTRKRRPVHKQTCKEFFLLPLYTDQWIISYVNSPREKLCNKWDELHSTFSGNLRWMSWYVSRAFW